MALRRRRWTRNHSLTSRTLLQVACGVTCILATSSGFVYALMLDELEGRATEQLERYVLERSSAESKLLTLARDTQHAVRRAVLEAYPSYESSSAAERFEKLFLFHPDGSVRSRPELLSGKDPVNAWIRRGTPVTLELRHRMVLFHDVIERFKAAALVRFADIFITAPEQLNIGTDPPGLPQWAQAVAADFDQNAEAWATVADLERNPSRETIWLRAHFDTVYQALMIGVATPIDYGGRHIGTVYNDLMLEELVRSLLRAGMPGAKHCVFARDGHLIAHTDKMNDIVAANADYLMQTSGDATLLALLGAVKHSEPFVSRYDEGVDQYFAVSRIEGIGWYFASMISGDVMRGQALRAVRWVLWAGFGSLAVVLMVLALILRRSVALPLSRLTRAAERIASGETTGILLREHARDEIGRLAGAFNDMAHKISERDLTLRREARDLERALAAVRETEERWRALTEHASDVVVVLDARLSIRYWSSTVESVLGYAANERLGEPFIRFAHVEDEPALKRQLEQTLSSSSGQRLAGFRFRARCKDGTHRHLEGGSGNLLSNPAVRGIVLNLRDISAQVRADEQLELQREALHQRDRLAAMGSLLAGVAHELNNPLSVVVGRSIMLEESESDGAKRSSAQKIRAAAERCARIVKTFLAMARQREQRKSCVRIETIIDSALEVVEYSLRTSDIEVVRTIEPELPALSVDADQLLQVFMNLFVNAQQAMAQSARPRRLEITARRSPAEDALEVVVCDSGPGIPSEIRGRIFDPFFTTKPMGEGTGIGLSVSLGILEAHGGTLAEQSTPGKGARFVVTLPQRASDGSETAPAGPVRTLGRAPGRRRVLVVDDDEDVLATLVDILARAQHDTSCCKSGTEAIVQLGLRVYDVIISDLRMPEGDGPALYRELQARFPWLLPRLVFMSGDELSADLRRFLADVQRPIIEKPFTPDAVERAIAEIVRAGAI